MPSKYLLLAVLGTQTCKLCLRKTNKITLLKCETCQQLGLLAIMCKKCVLDHHKTNTHIGNFAIAYPSEVLEL